MAFAVVCIGLLAGLAIIAAVASCFDKGSDEIVTAEGHDCATCTSADDGSCKIHCLMEERRSKERRSKERRSKEE